MMLPDKLFIIDLRKGHSMHEKNSHCSYCGSRFPDAEPWPRHCHACGNTKLPESAAGGRGPDAGGDGLVVIRRNIEPRKGTLTLPGGYIDLGETWQEGARRELLEETGIEISVNDITLYDVENGWTTPW